MRILHRKKQYLVSILVPLTTQGAVPDPLSVSIVQTSHSQTLSIHSHLVKIYTHRPKDRDRTRDESSTGFCPCKA